MQAAPAGFAPRCRACNAWLITDDGRPQARAPAAEAWYVRSGEGEAGPFSASELSDQLARNQLQWSSEVWRAGLSSWRPARRDELLVLGIASARGLAEATTRLDSVHALLHSEALPTHDISRDADFEHALEFLDLEPDDEEEPDAASEGRASERSGLVRSLPPARPSLSTPLSLSARDVPTGRVARHSLPSLTGGSRRRTWFIAAAAFVTGALLAMGPAPAAQAGRELARWLDIARGPGPRAVPDVAASRPVAPRALPPALVAPLAARPGAAPPLRDQPSQDEVRAALRELAPTLRRCMRDPRRGLALELSIEGASGRVRQLDVSATLGAGELECISDVFVDFHVPPFAEPTLHSRYRYRW